MRGVQIKAMFQKGFFKKHGKKALILYLCWWLFKGLLFLLYGLLWM